MRVKHREYASCRTRKLSFGSCRFISGPNVQELATAGFFYAGHKDFMRCYRCGTLIMNWFGGQDPIQLHSNKSPNCCVLHTTVETERPDEEIEISNNHGDRPSTISSNFPASEVSQLTDRLLDIQLQNGERSSDQNGNGQTLNTNPPQFERTNSYIERIEQEMTTLREALMCKVCMDNTANVVTLPCAHFTSCVTCSTALTSCPQCRQRISTRIKVYV